MIAASNSDQTEIRNLLHRAFGEGRDALSAPEELRAAHAEILDNARAYDPNAEIQGVQIQQMLDDERVHALILGYWHTIITPPMVFAELLGEVVQDARQRGIDKPIVCSLAGDVEVEQACARQNEFDILTYPYATEKPIAVLDAKHRWARGAGLVQMAQD